MEGAKIESALENNICKYGVTSMYHQVFLSEKLYEDEEVDLPIPIIYYSR